MTPVSFHDETNTLFFVPAFFKAKKMGRSVTWITGIKGGTTIKKGQAIAKISWNNGDVETIKSPVAGVVRKTNRKINNAELSFLPPQFALVMR